MWNVSIFKKLAQLFLKRYVGQQNMSVGCQFVTLVLKQDIVLSLYPARDGKAQIQMGKHMAPLRRFFLNVLIQPVGECKAGVSSSRGVS